MWHGIDRFFFELKMLRVITNWQKKQTSYYDEMEVVSIYENYFEFIWNFNSQSHQMTREFTSEYSIIILKAIFLLRKEDIPHFGS